MYKFKLAVSSELFEGQSLTVISVYQRFVCATTELVPNMAVLRFVVWGLWSGVEA